MVTKNKESSAEDSLIWLTISIKYDAYQRYILNLF